jgi:hypothetical protein
LARPTRRRRRSLVELVCPDRRLGERTADAVGDTGPQ